MTAVAPAPLFVVVEDGHEYLERFQRFLGTDFRFVRAAGLDATRAALANASASALLFDLDFRRLPPEALVDESGRPATPPSKGERARLTEVQGILILRALRAGAVTLPALLFADIADAEQVRFLERTLAPLTVLSSSAGLPQIRDHLRRLGARPGV
jgi:hypothetical protein